MNKGTLKLYIFTTVFLSATIASALQTPLINVEDMQICLSIKDREPVDAGKKFSEYTQRLYCFTRLKTDQESSSVSHVWYRNDKEMAGVELEVHGKNWRTWSSKKIVKGSAGDWRVDVVSPLGQVLASREFVILSRADLEEEYTPRAGMPGKDVEWVPSSKVAVNRMLDVAEVTPEDYVIDLGSGDGRIVISAAKIGARALGIEYNPELVEFSRQTAAKEGVGHKTDFVKADLFETDFSRATVITMFLREDINLDLRPKILDMRPGTRVVSNNFDMGEWKADKIITIEDENYYFKYSTLYYWIVPARVEGAWEYPRGKLILEQNFQMIKGILKSGTTTTTIEGKMTGNLINFTTANNIKYTGRVTGDQMEVKPKNGSGVGWKATRLPG